MTATAHTLRIARNRNLYGSCKSIVAYRDDVEIGRAGMFHRDGKLSWDVGPSGFEGTEAFDITLDFDPATTTCEAMLDRVETALRLSISAAETMKEAA